MTERKPAAMTFGSWIDQQIADAQERGSFDNLPLAGKPLPPGRAEFDGQAWAREWIRREGGTPEDCLPTPLRLRKERERLFDEVASLRTEQAVRERAQELNERILAWRRLPLDGPPVVVPLADVDALVDRWREARTGAGAGTPAEAGAPGQTGAPTGAPGTGSSPKGRSRWRWRQRARR